MIFSPPSYSLLQSKLRRKYKSRWKKFLPQLKKIKSAAFPLWVLDNQELLEDYSPFNWFFLSQIETYLFFKEHEQSENSSESDFSDEDEEVFDRWNASEMADIFLKKINQRKTVLKASKETLKDYEQHLITLGNRHLLKEDRVKSFYRPHPSLGEKKVGPKVVRLLETTINMDGKQISLKTSSLKEMKKHSHNIEEALRIIKHCSPTSWQRFSSFTEVIVPIKNVEFVSYSHQELPGFSMINLYHRDFVDLMDDLLHENGHHHLNFYLNLGQLIEEPQEQIYFSPWRRTLRPLRGIYHAYFTFFWAFKLFADLLNCNDLDEVHLFTSAEHEKMIFRALEEFWMLNFTYEDLKWARKKRLITDTGWELISAQNRELQKAKKKVMMWEKKLKKTKKALNELKAELRSAARLYKKA